MTREATSEFKSQKQDWSQNKTQSASILTESKGTSGVLV